MSETESTDHIEIWKPVVGWEGCYEISSFARIRNIRTGFGNKQWQWRILKQHKHASGYLQVILSKKPFRKTFLVHRLVVNSFIRQIPHGYEVNHKDGNKINNHVSNLEIVTRSQNALHACRVLGIGIGVKSSHARLNPQKVREIRCMITDGKLSLSAIGRIYGVRCQAISYIKAGLAWIHVV